MLLLKRYDAIKERKGFPQRQGRLVNELLRLLAIIISRVE